MRPPIFRPLGYGNDEWDELKEAVRLRTECERQGKVYDPREQFSAEIFERDGHYIVTIYDMWREWTQAAFQPTDFTIFLAHLEAANAACLQGLYGLTLDTEECADLARLCRGYISAHKVA